MTLTGHAGTTTGRHRGFPRVGETAFIIDAFQGLLTENRAETGPVVARFFARTRRTRAPHNSSLNQSAVRFPLLCATKLRT